MSVSVKVSVKDKDRCAGCQACMAACSRHNGVGGLAGTRISVRSDGGMEKGFVVVVCRACPDPPCARVCPTPALTTLNNPGVQFNADLCIGCQNCVNACPFGAIYWNNEQAKPQVCNYCGYCVKYCLYDVIVMQPRQKKE